MQINAALQHGRQCEVSDKYADAWDVNEHFAMLLAWCGPGGPGLYAGLFLAGLAGSPMHCGPMCGPFVLGQTADRMAAMPAARMCELARLRTSLLLPYHAGRLLTYAGLGAIAGAIGAIPLSGRLGGVLLMLGAILLLAQGAKRLAPAGWALPRLPFPPEAWLRTVSGLARRIDRQHMAGGLLLGLVLGFLPCGFLYAGFAVAASAGDVMRGGLAMLAFGAGTVPALVLVGWLGGSARGVWRRRLAVIAPIIMLANGAVLTAAAWVALRG